MVQGRGDVLPFPTQGEGLGTRVMLPRFELHVDYKSPGSEGRQGKAREPIAYLELYRRPHELVELGKRLRPDIS